MTGKFFDGSKSAITDGKEVIVFVEGADDAYFADSLLTDLAADEGRIGIIYSGGTGQIPSSIRELVLSSSYVRRNVKTVGIIRDADEDAVAALSAVNRALARENIAEPRHGEIVAYDGDRRIGAYIIPDGASTGNLESLLLQANEDDDRLEAVTECFDRISAKHGELPGRHKRLAQMYMALRLEDCRGVGRAFGLGVFGRSAEVVAVRDFLARLIA